MTDFCWFFLGRR